MMLLSPYMAVSFASDFSDAMFNQINLFSCFGIVFSRLALVLNFNLVKYHSVKILILLHRLHPTCLPASDESFRTSRVTVIQVCRR